MGNIGENLIIKNAKTFDNARKKCYNIIEVILLNSTFCVYCHTNKINGKQYVGMTNSTKRRWHGTGSEYKPRKNENSNRPFPNAIIKYGWNNFSHEILEDNLSFEQACELEKYYINKYDTTNNKKGYNVSDGGNGGKVYKIHPRNMLGKHQTEYQKQHQKEWASKQENNCMTNGIVVWGKTHPHPKGMLNKYHSLDDKKRISETLQAKNINCKKIKVTFSDDTIQIFKSKTEASHSLSISVPTLNKLIATKSKYKVTVKNQYFDIAKKHEGLAVEEL